jgi:hypothetical protein
MNAIITSVQLYVLSHHEQERKPGAQMRLQDRVIHPAGAPRSSWRHVGRHIGLGFRTPHNTGTGRGGRQKRRINVPLTFSATRE